MDSRSVWTRGSLGRAVCIVTILAILFGLVATLTTGLRPVLASSGGDVDCSVRTFIDSQGLEVMEVLVAGKPPKAKMASVDLPQAEAASGVNTLTDVPAFDWSYGCSPTAAAMLFGYYDRTGYANMYTGPTDNGVCPLDNSVWGETLYPSVMANECPLSAAHRGVDGQGVNAHVDDYWIDFGNNTSDPYIVNGWSEHASACAGDFMGTSQSRYGNKDGSTSFFFLPNGDPLYDYAGSEPISRDGGHGLRLFAESRGYTVVTNFNQVIQGQASDPTKGFTFDAYMAEIDAGRPVIIHVVGHTMLGFGYDTAGSIVYLRDGWDHSTHQMTWGGTYGTKQHKSVTVIRLGQVSGAPAVTTGDASNVATSSARLNGNLTSLGTASSVTVSFVWGTASGSYPNETAGVAKTATGSYYCDLGSLTAGTTYYYKAKAVGSGTVYGVEKSFTTGTTPGTTPPALTQPPAATTGSASRVKSSSAALNGSLVSLGSASTVYVSFEYGTGPGNYSVETTPKAMTSTGGFSTNLRELAPGTTYYFRAKAVGDGSSYGEEQSFTTASAASARVVKKLALLEASESSFVSPEGGSSSQTDAGVVDEGRVDDGAVRTAGIFGETSIVWLAACCGVGAVCLGGVLYVVWSLLGHGR